MRTVLLICRRCGYQGKVQILTDAELRDPRISRGPTRCPKCQNISVEIRQ